MASNWFVLSVIMFLITTNLFSLEVQRGKIKLVINERTGRYVVWGTEDEAKPVWTALYLSDENTTKWKLSVSDKVVSLGDDAAYPATVESTASGAKITWTSKIVVAAMTIDFILSPNASSADGVKVSMNVVNVSDAPVKLGVRWVLDTNLGEKKEHYRFSSNEVVSSETRLEGNYPESYSSRSGAEEQPGLLVMLGKGVTPPNRVIFANWKRLDDSAWDTNFKQGRDFNLLPYSFNDSAVCTFYDPLELPAGTNREVLVIFGLASAQSFVGSRLGSPNPIDDLLKKKQNPALSVLDQDLSSLDTLANQIDAKLAEPNRVTPEDLRLLQSVLDQIDVRRKALGATKP